MRRCVVEWPAGSGVLKDGEELTWQVDPGSEEWSHYTLEDGSRAKIKHILMRVVRLDERMAPESQPTYVFFPTDLNVIHTAPHMMIDETARPTTPPPSDVQHDQTPPPRSDDKENGQ